MGKKILQGDREKHSMTGRKRRGRGEVRREGREKEREGTIRNCLSSK